MSTLLRVTAVLVLGSALAACSSDESSGDTDSGTSAGNNTGGDGGASNDGDNTSNNGDGGTTGADGGNNGPAAFACPNGATTLTAAGGQVTSDDGFLALSLSAGAVAQNTDIKVCAVPQAKWPAAAGTDGTGPVSALYQIEPLGLTFAGNVNANLTIQGAALTAITNSDGISPLTFHRIPNAGTPARLNTVTMRLLAEPVLSGELDGAGYVYARHVDSAGARYGVQVTTGAALTKLTGETFDLSTKVTVVGTPNATTRALSLITRGCDLEPLQPLGVEQAHVKEGNCEVEPVLREGTNLTVAGGALSAGAVIDLTSAGSDVDATHLPPRFFCTAPGAAMAAVHLGFGVGADREVTVIAEQGVTCTPSGDAVYLGDVIGATQLLHGPVVPTLSPFGTPIPFADVQLMKPTARGTLVAGDSFVYAAPGRTLTSLEGLTTFTLRGPGNFVPVAFGMDETYKLVLPGPRQTVPVMPIEGGALKLENDSNVALVTLNVASRASLKVTFDTPSVASPAVLFEDGLIDLVLIRGNTTTSTGSGIRFERWVRASSAPLTGSRRRVDLLTAAHSIALDGITPSSIDIWFFNVAWDETRSFAATGRITPLAGGFAIRVAPSTLARPPLVSPCVAVDASATTCDAGLNEHLAVATQSGVELFDPIDGRYVKTLLNGTTLGAQGFRQVVQGSDGCIYASQQNNGANGNGIWRYSTNGTALTAQNAPYIALAQADDGAATAFTPRGLTVVDGDLLVANEGGGVLRFDAVNGANGTWLVDYLSVATYSPNSVFLANTGGAGRLFTTDAKAAAGSQKWIQSDPPATSTAVATGIVDRVSVLSNPQQVTTDAGALLDVLIANAGGHDVRLYSRAVPGTLPQTPERTISFGAQTPQGIHPLLNGSWLVAGTDNLDVQAVVPGLVEQPKTIIRDTGDAYYISRVCMP